MKFNRSAVCLYFSHVQTTWFEQHKYCTAVLHAIHIHTAQGFYDGYTVDDKLHRADGSYVLAWSVRAVRLARERPDGTNFSWCQRGTSRNLLVPVLAGSLVARSVA